MPRKGGGGGGGILAWPGSTDELAYRGDVKLASTSDASNHAHTVDRGKEEADATFAVGCCSAAASFQLCKMDNILTT